MVSLGKKLRNILYLFTSCLSILALAELSLATEIPPPEAWTERGIVLEKGPKGAWDANSNYVRVGSVVKKDETYFMYYIGSSGSGCSDGGVDDRAIGVATSTDGINFKKYSGNPIITHQVSSINRCEEGAGFGLVALDDNGNFVMFWEAITAVGAHTVSGDIHLSTSNGGFNFTDEGIVIPYTIDGGGDEVWPVGVLHAQGGTPSSIGKWHVWYMTDGYGGYGGYKVALATGDIPGSFTEQQSSPVIDSVSRSEWPVLHPDGTVSLFQVHGWSSSKIDVVETTVDALDTYSAPVMIFLAPPDGGYYTTVAVLPDFDDNIWRMYYTSSDAAIRLRTAPFSNSRPPSAPTGLKIMTNE